MKLVGIKIQMALHLYVGPSVTYFLAVTAPSEGSGTFYRKIVTERHLTESPLSRTPFDLKIFLLKKVI
jgi:hypothetical protein